jgi:hypothetical protein
VRRAIVVFGSVILTTAAFGGPQDATARRLLASWKDDEPGVRAVAEVIASAFASGLAWAGTLAEKGVYCPPPGLDGPEVMSALESYVGEQPRAADQPYGEALAAALRRAFPCQSP